MTHGFCETLIIVFLYNSGITWTYIIHKFQVFSEISISHANKSIINNFQRMWNIIDTINIDTIYIWICYFYFRFLYFYYFLSACFTFYFICPLQRYTHRGFQFVLLDTQYIFCDQSYARYQWHRRCGTWSCVFSWKSSLWSRRRYIFQ